MSLGQSANNGENLCQKVKELGGVGCGQLSWRNACLEGSVIHTQPTLHNPALRLTLAIVLELRVKVQGYS